MQVDTTSASSSYASDYSCDAVALDFDLVII